MKGSEIPPSSEWIQKPPRLRLLPPEPAGEQCWNCEQVYDPNATRWLCPHCGAKGDCCSGQPLACRQEGETNAPEA